MLVPARYNSVWKFSTEISTGIKPRKINRWTLRGCPQDGFAAADVATTPPPGRAPARDRRQIQWIAPRRSGEEAPVDGHPKKASRIAPPRLARPDSRRFHARDVRSLRP